MKKFRVLSSEMIVDEPFCHVEKQTVKLHDGSETDWFLRHSPDAVIVLPISPKEEILLQRTYKHGAGTVVTEFPAGMVDAKETPQLAAARELREETGLVAKKLIPLGTVFSDPTGSPMQYHFFVAEDCRKIAERELDETEQIETFWVKDFAEAKSLLCTPEETRKRKTQHSRASAASLCVLPLAEEFFRRKKSAKKI